MRHDSKLDMYVHLRSSTSSYAVDHPHPQARSETGVGVAPLLWTGQGYAVVVSSGAVASIFS